MRFWIFAVLLCFVTASFATVDQPKNFQCPENLPSDEARKAANLEFTTWAEKHYEDLTVEKFVLLRMKALEQNHCTETLSNISASGSSASESTRFSCVGQGNTKYYTRQRKAQCAPLPLETSWENFAVEPGFVVDYMPSKIIIDQDGSIKLWVQFYLAQTSISADRTWSYNHVKSLNKFYCNRRQTVLVQGTYSRDNKVTYERLSNESVVEEIAPNTLNDAILSKICK